MQRPETKKILAVILIICGIVWVSVSYILAAVGQYSTNETISTAVVYAILGVFASYTISSYAEKNSRNKYGIDRDGNKINEDDKGDD